jgi:hypothetical protein
MNTLESTTANSRTMQHNEYNKYAQKSYFAACNNLITTALPGACSSVAG